MFLIGSKKYSNRLPSGGKFIFKQTLTSNTVTDSYLHSHA